MASTNRPPSDPPGGRRRRPPTVINLEATEVTPQNSETQPSAFDDPAPQEQAETSAPTQPKPEDVPPEQVAFEPAAPESPVEAKSSESAPSESPQPAYEPAPAPDRSQPWLPVVAGLSGAGGALVLFLLLWVFGAFPTAQPTPLSDQAQSGSTNPRLAAIEQQLRELANRPAPVTVDPRALNDIVARLAKLEGAASAPHQPAADPSVQNRIAASESAAKTTADNVAGVSRRLDTLEASLREISGQVEKLAVASAQLQARARETGAGNDRASRFAITAAALRGAVERGEPYATELAIVKPLTTNAAAVAQLEPFASSGLPSEAALGQELAAIVRPMLSAPAEAPHESNGFLEKMQAHAEKLVRIRPIEETRGDARVAVLSRIEQRAAQGNVPAASSELSKLPPEVRTQTALQAWTAKVEARTKAVEASRTLAADAVTALKASP